MTHFVFNQRIDSAFRTLYMVCVLCMGIFIQYNEAYERAFLISYGALHFVMVLMFLKVLMIPRGKNHAIWWILHSMATIMIVIVVFMEVSGKCAIHWFGIYSGLFIFENLSTYGSYIVSQTCNFEPKIALPLNVPHIAERYGLFIMLILGESIISIMGAELGDLNLEEKFEWDPDGAPPSQILIVVMVLVFYLTYCIARLYYDCQPSEEAIMCGHDNHALRISATTGRLYMLAHQMLFFGLLGLGVGIKIAAKHLLDPKRRWIDVLLPGYSLVIIVIALNIIRVAHPYNVHTKIWIFRGILLFIMIITPLFTHVINNAVILGVLFGCVVLQFMVDVEGKEKIKNEKEEMKERREKAKLGALSEIDREETAPSAAPPSKDPLDPLDPLNSFRQLRRVVSGVGKM